PILCPSSSFYDAPATAVIDALSLHDALPISPTGGLLSRCRCTTAVSRTIRCWWGSNDQRHKADYRADQAADHGADQFGDAAAPAGGGEDGEGAGHPSEPAHRRRPALPLPPPLRRTRRAHRYPVARSRRTGHRARPSAADHGAPHAP